MHTRGAIGFFLTEHGSASALGADTRLSLPSRRDEDLPTLERDHPTEFIRFEPIGLERDHDFAPTLEKERFLGHTRGLERARPGLIHGMNLPYMQICASTISPEGASPFGSKASRPPCEIPRSVRNPCAVHRDR